jgi:CheY-like chemotaxis protein
MTGSTTPHDTDARSLRRMSARPLVIVHDGNADAVIRRRDLVAQVAPDAEVLATRSQVAVQVLATVAPDDTVVLVDLCSADRPSLDRPGVRLIERLAHSPSTEHVRPVAWSAYLGADVVDAARAAGAAAFVTATMRAEVEISELERVLGGDAPWPEAVVPPDAWDTWFARTYGAPWKPWMEPVLVRLAATGERRSIAGDLVERAAARSTTHAKARMREVARLVAGELSAAPIVVAERAQIVLAQLAAYRPLEERPESPISLSQTADILRHQPSMAIAAGLTAIDVQTLIALDDLIRTSDATTTRSVGAPPADKVRAERHWAAGRLAVQAASGVDDINIVITGILRRVDRALAALDDARMDAEVACAPRAAAALLAAAQVGGGGPTAISERAGRVTWRGRTIEQLACSDDLPDDELRAFTDSVDTWLAARRSG